MYFLYFFTFLKAEPPCLFNHASLKNMEFRRIMGGSRLQQIPDFYILDLDLIQKQQTFLRTKK